MQVFSQVFFQSLNKLGLFANIVLSSKNFVCESKVLLFFPFLHIFDYVHKMVDTHSFYSKEPQKTVDKCLPKLG